MPYSDAHTPLWQTDAPPSDVPTLQQAMESLRACIQKLQPSQQQQQQQQQQMELDTMAVGDQHRPKPNNGCVVDLTQVGCWITWA